MIPPWERTNAKKARNIAFAQSFVNAFEPSRFFVPADGVQWDYLIASMAYARLWRMAYPRS